MMIAFFVNDIEREYRELHDHRAGPSGGQPRAIACATSRRPISSSTPDDACASTAASCRKRKYKDRAEFFEALNDDKAIKIERLDVTEIDVLMLRNDPSIDAQQRRGRRKPASCSGARRASAA